MDPADVHQKGEELSERHTESNGHRLKDSLPVATALYFGADTLLTFDGIQMALAKDKGVTVEV